MAGPLTWTTSPGRVLMIAGQLLDAEVMSMPSSSATQLPAALSLPTLGGGVDKQLIRRGAGLSLLSQSYLRTLEVRPKTPGALELLMQAMTYESTDIYIGGLLAETLALADVGTPADTWLLMRRTAYGWPGVTAAAVPPRAVVQADWSGALGGDPVAVVVDGAPAAGQVAIASGSPVVTVGSGLATGWLTIWAPLRQRCRLTYSDEVAAAGALSVTLIAEEVFG